MASNSSRQSLVPLLPASTPFRPPASQPPKKSRISAACEACRTRKTRCNGDRPKCRECAARQTPCRYSGTENAVVKRKYEELRQRMSAHEELFERVRTMPEQEMHEVLRRIRAGVDAEAILNHLKDGNLLMQLSLVPERRSHYELPYVRDMPAFLIQSANSYTDTLICECSFSSSNNNSNVLNTRQAPPNSSQIAHQSIHMTPYHAAESVDPKLDLATIDPTVV